MRTFPAQVMLSNATKLRTGTPQDRPNICMIQGSGNLPAMKGPQDVEF
jgi:hypothetical protein